MDQSINAIRFTGLDMCNAAESGHPGIVLGAAPVVYRLFTEHLLATPNDAGWFNRDRFVLSAGHGTALLYPTLHFAGYDVTMEDLKQFRQLDSKTPGHPEYGETDGVEATSGPLGQGVSMAVGMAVAEANLRARFNTEDLPVVDHYIYTLVGDGDLQEGVALESLSLAGHLNLEKLVVLFDSNDVQLDGPVADAFSADLKKKFESLGFDYRRVADANDLDAVGKAIEEAKQSGSPSLIEIKSVIGFGSSVAGTSAAHGKPIGKEETEKMREAFGYTHPPFDPPKAVYQDFFDHFVKRGDAARQAWEKQLETYKQRHPERYRELMDIIEGRVRADLDKLLAPVENGTVDATRASMGKVLEAITSEVPSMIGGSADLSGSTKVKGPDGNFTRDSYEGRNLNFGVREHAMGAITNGLVLHGMRAFSGGFLIFSDYMKPAIRLAALQGIPSMFLFTHDSIAVGEDGPTHEPVEQLTIYRATPNTDVLRPANASEVHHALRYALEQTDRPTIISLTRQKVTQLREVHYEDFQQGAYVVSDKDNFEGILIASGSEVETAIRAQEILEERHDVKVRVVSMPSMELFERQPQAVREAILPPEKQKRLAVELGSPDSWYRYARDVHAVRQFGKSGKGDEILKDFGFTPEAVAERYLRVEDRPQR